MKDWFKARKIWGAAILSLSDTEAGRLMKAVWAYTMTGEKQELSGAERGAYAMILMTLEQDEQADAELSKKRAVYGAKGGKQTQAKPSKSKQMQANALQESTPLPPLSPPSLLPPTPPNNIPPIIPQNPPKDEIVVEVVENTRGQEGMPFGLTEEEIHRSILQTQQIEDKAKSIGLQVTEAGMFRGRELARQYGLDQLLDAMTKAVDHPTWAYVEGVLRKGGQDRGHRDDRGIAQGEVRTDYSFLRD